MSKKETKQVTMMVPVSLWNSIEQLARQSGYRDKRGSHARIFRETLSSHLYRERSSPYVCHSAEHVVFVSRDGHVFHRQREELQLNTKLRQLPCSMKMKPEKIMDFLLRRDPGLPEAEWFQSRWLLNCFVASHQGAALSSWVDRDGTTAKGASLAIDQGPNRLITREYLIGLQDYVQWRETASGLLLPEADSHFDRIDLVLQIPTRNLSVVVVVDTALYRNTPFASESEIPALAMEFRNLEGTLFEDRSIAQDQENPMTLDISDRYIGQGRPPQTDKILKKLRELQNRIFTIGEAEADNGPVLNEEERQRMADAFTLPEHFLFYTLEWPTPQVALSVCVRWEKPVRLSRVQ